MSSRNAYLDATQRKQALVLHRSLTRVEKMVNTGERNAARLVAAGREEFAAEPSVRLDYFEVVNSETLDPVDDNFRRRTDCGGRVCRQYPAHRQCADPQDLALNLTLASYGFG